METRSSYVLVGAVVLALAIALFAFVLWLARFDAGAVKREYDVLFPTVSGLAVGSGVNFQGVPVGQVQSVNLMPDRPDKVRVRIEVNSTTPIFKGTTATLAGVGFTGVSVVSLEGSMAGGQDLTDKGPWGRPVIPVKPGALAGLLESAPLLLNNADRLVDNLNEVLNEQNRAKLTALLDNLNNATRAYEARAPEVSQTLAEAQVTLKRAGSAAEKAGSAAEKVGRLADASTIVVTEQGNALVTDIRATTVKANAALDAVTRAANAAEPGLEALSATTVPQANALIGDLRATNSSLGAVAGRLDEDPLGALLGGRALPDYNPEKTR